MTRIKFCGMTRPADVAAAADLGVDYIGCVLAGGPRHRTPSEAAGLFGVLSDGGPSRVGVFPTPGEAETAAGAGLRVDVLQIHGEADASALRALRARVGRPVWAALRCRDGKLPSGAGEIWDAADAVLLDAHVPGLLGGTGVRLPWSNLADQVAMLRVRPGADRLLVLAGGLSADTVGEAILALRPHIVDTSSGIESAPGIKDGARMRAFVDAVTEADRALGAAPGARRS